MPSRRTFFRAVVAGAAVASCGRPWRDAAAPLSARNGRGQRRRDEAYRVRYDSALRQKSRPAPADATNGDEERYPTRCASYSKGLPHTDHGKVDLAAYNRLLAAIRSGDPDDFAAVPMGGSLRQVNPRAAYTFALQGGDSH